MEDNNNQALHKKFAVDLFNLTWELIKKTDRTQAELDQMIHAAHGSRFHWEYGKDAVNIARGEWLISRVYAVSLRAEPCLFHAQRCHQVTLDHDLQDFDLAFAYESMARAEALAANPVESDKYFAVAKLAGKKIQKPDDQDYFFSELDTVPTSIE